MHKAQRGITLIGFLLLLAGAGFFAYVGMLLIPAYAEYFGVVKAMQAVVADVASSNESVEQIRGKLGFNFNLQYVGAKTVPPSGILLDTQGGKRTLRVTYDKEIPFFLNISFLLHFDHAENLVGTMGY